MAQPEYWRVTLSIDPARHDEIWQAARATLPAERVSVVVVFEGEDRDSVGSIELSVLASDEREAREKAIATYLQVTERAGFANAEPVVVGVMSPIFRPNPYDALFDEAEQLAEDDRNELAVLRAQTAAELCGKIAFNAMFSVRLSDRWKKDALRLVRPGLSDPRSRNVFEALTGSRPEHEPWWTAYHRHLERRHAIAHDGLSVSSGDATESLEAVQAFIDYVRRVWAGTKPPHPG